ncbi:hypothetical protein [Amycolatopsis sp. DG1A-15b]|uniref:hypothetical protein n=1 Tax=Amycolatopsis sp. DG1A-15b TaxID=3052846 RepID=UPI00255C1EB5|nr:hypothetical protein [Amycolatopsis sp. DG1A-15b]WIX87581.1 hypothetical protein QRY02_41640 [Amycolatopsis sp. DG1A-15b]
MSQGTEFHGHAAAAAHPGRHRRGSAESWTPPLPQHRPVRHRAAGNAPEPGSLPLRHHGSGEAPESGSYSPRYREAAEPAEGGSHPLWHRGAAEQPEGSYPVRYRGDAEPLGGARSWPHHAPTEPFEGGSHPLRRHPPAGSPEAGNRPFAGGTTGPTPADPAVSGCLPLPQPSLPQPRDRRPAPPLFPASHGSLPLDAFEDDDLEPGPDEAPVAESRADLAARRTRVSLVAPTPRSADFDDDDVRIYSAPPLDGLGGFTIGSVPASVTPPKTWRKAAWFATGASGAVVVGLLCAGSFLVGKPPMDQAVQGSWPGYQGVPTIADPTGEHRPPTQGGSAPGPESASRPGNTAGKTHSGGGAGPVDGVAPPPARATTTPGKAKPGTADPSAAPRKPPVTPAQRENPVKPPWWYSFPPDAQTMGDNSEKFFNTVTTDPSAASSVTTGHLHDQGPQALADRYAGIAYFEVKKVSIDQQRGVTVNTVEVTHTDGTKTVEERTLTFGDGDKITADGQ